MLDDVAGFCLQGCRERVVFDAVERWAYGCAPQCGSQLVQSLADVEGLLLLIRFPLMSQTELEVKSDIPPVTLLLPSLQCHRPHNFLARGKGLYASGLALILGSYF